MSYFFWHLLSHEKQAVGAPFGPLTPGSIQRHATFLTRDLWAPSGGSEYHLEVCESADCLQTIRDVVIKLLWKVLFCQDVRCVFQSLFQVCFNMFYKFGCIFFGCLRNCHRLPPGTCPSCHSCLRRWCAVRDGIVAGKTCEGFGNVGNTRITRTVSVKACWSMLKRSFLFSGGRVFHISILGSCGCSTLREKVDRQEQLRTFFDMQDAAGFFSGRFLFIFCWWGWCFFRFFEILQLNRPFPNLKPVMDNGFLWEMIAKISRKRWTWIQQKSNQSAKKQ